MHAHYAPKTNISKAYYKHVVDQIEHDPLVKHSTFAVVCLIAASCILAGGLLWFAKTTPGNLVRTPATVRTVSEGRTDNIGTVSTFVSFDFVTKDGDSKTVRQQTNDGLLYQSGQSIIIGYHPKNPNYARNLTDNRPPVTAIVLWLVPIGMFIWLGFIAAFRFHARQVEIWNAAEAADADE